LSQSITGIELILTLSSSSFDGGECQKVLYASLFNST